MLIVLPIAAVACFLAGRWTHTPTLDTSIPSTPSTAADLAALCKKLDDLPRDSAESKRTRADLQSRVEHVDAEALCMEIVNKPQFEEGDQSLSDIALREVFRRHGAEYAWELALKMQAAVPVMGYYSTVYSAMHEQGLEAALQKLETFPDSSEKTQAIDETILVLAKTDPQRGIALALQALQGDQDNSTVTNIFRQMTKQAPAQARAALADLDGKPRLRAVQGIVATLKESDPAAAWKVLTDFDIPVEDDYDSMHRKVLEEWVNHDPPAAAAALYGIRESKPHGKFFEEFLQRWSRKYFNAALDYVLQIDDPDLSKKGLDILGSRNWSSPPTALARRLFDIQVEKTPPGKDLENALEPLLYDMARKDPMAAIEAVSTLPPGEMQTSIAKRIVTSSAAHCKSKALKKQVLDWVAALPGGEMRKECIWAFFNHLGEDDDSQATLAMLAASSLSPEEQNSARRSLAWWWSRHDPKAAFDWVAAHFPDGKDRTEVLSQAIRYIGEYHSPSEALAALQSQPALMQDKHAVFSLVDVWAQRDAAAAERWTRDLPDGSIKDEAVSCVCRHLAPNNPQAALAAADTIDDFDQRTSCIWNIATMWKHYDPTAATAWIDQNNPKSPKQIEEWDLPKR